MPPLREVTLWGPSHKATPYSPSWRSEALYALDPSRWIIKKVNHLEHSSLTSTLIKPISANSFFPSLWEWVRNYAPINTGDFKSSLFKKCGMVLPLLFLPQFCGEMRTRGGKNNTLGGSSLLYSELRLIFWSLVCFGRAKCLNLNGGRFSPTLQLPTGFSTKIFFNEETKKNRFGNKFEPKKQCNTL